MKTWTRTLIVKWSRFATAYAPDGAGGIRPMKDPESSPPPPATTRNSARCCSTAARSGSTARLMD